MKIEVSCPGHERGGRATKKKNGGVILVELGRKAKSRVRGKLVFREMAWSFSATGTCSSRISHLHTLIVPSEEPVAIR